MNRKPTNRARKTINFLNTLFEEELRTMSIKYRITIITWVRNIIGKHHHIESVQAKPGLMSHQVNYFKVLFVELFQKGLPPFWDEDGKTIHHSQ